MDTARVIEVVETTLTRRGDGTEKSPVRIVTQYWSTGGELLAENDPCQDREINKEILRLREAINWALGIRDEFRERKPGEGEFWWRSELRKRSGI